MSQLILVSKATGSIGSLRLALVITLFRSALAPLTEDEAQEVPECLLDTSNCALLHQAGSSTKLEPNGIAAAQVTSRNVCSGDGMKHTALYMRMLSRHVWKISAIKLRL